MAKAAEPTNLLRVTAAFVGSVDGEEIQFVYGELISADHPAVKKWPDAFGPLTLPYPVNRKAEPRIEQATAAPGEKRGA
jgi:hypothetical protein